MGKGGGSAPEAPDPWETAEAESYWNRFDTYSPGGGGVRYGYTDMNGEFTQGLPGQGGGGMPNPGGGQGGNIQPAQGQTNSWGNPMPPQGGSGGGGFTAGTFDPSAGQGGGGGSGGQGGYMGPGGGVGPGGYMRNAITYVETPTEEAIRLMLEPASVDLVSRMIDDNVTNMPDAARLRDRSDVAQDIFDRNYSMMEPTLEAGHNRLLTNLQARGMPVGSEAFDQAYSQQQRTTEDTLSRLSMDANIAAGQEQAREFGLDSAQRQNAIAEIVAAMGGGYNPPNTVPSSAGAPNIDFSGMAQSQYQAEMAQYNQQQQQQSATMGALGSLGAALMKCTREAKDVRSVVDPHGAAQVAAQMPLYVWSYKEGEAPMGDTPGAPHIGPMAEDFHHLTGFGDGRTINPIDYNGLLLAGLQSALQRVEALEERLNQVQRRN